MLALFSVLLLTTGLFGDFTLPNLPLPTDSTGAMIRNEVSATASSGGSSAEGGTVVSGDASASVNLHTEVSGNVIEHRSVEVSSKGGAVEKIVTEKIATSSEGGTITVETDIRVSVRASSTPSEDATDTSASEAPESKSTIFSFTGELPVMRLWLNRAWGQLKTSFSNFFTRYGLHL